MNDVNQIIQETLHINEDDLGVDAKVKPEVTPELIDTLMAGSPELAECDKDMLLKGMSVEMEHFDTVGGDVATVARIVCDHIKEFPGKDYYAALEQMEHELKETPEEEKTEHAPGGEEGPAAKELPAGE